MKCCLSTDVGTLTNLLTFEPDPDYKPDAGTGLLSPISYRLRNFAALSRLPASCAATRNFTLGKSHVYVFGCTPLERAVVLTWFYSLSRRKTFVGGKCALSGNICDIEDVFHFAQIPQYSLFTKSSQFVLLCNS